LFDFAVSVWKKWQLIERARRYVGWRFGMSKKKRPST